MKRLFMFVMAMFCLSGAAFAQTIFPVQENFDGDVFPPSGWTTQNFEGGNAWNKGTNQVMLRGVASAYAMGGGGGSSLVSALVSPAIEIPASGEFILTFWSKFMWGEDGCEVGISKTVADSYDAFTIVKTMTGADVDNDNFREITITLPAEYSGETVYIAFIFKASSNFIAWAVDDFDLMELSDDPVFQGAATLNAGTVYNNIPFPLKANYTVTNRGGAALELSAGTSSSEITLPNLPITVNPSESKAVSVTIDANTNAIPEGEYSGNFTLATNDPNKPQVTVNVTGTVAKAAVNGFTEEGFNTNSNLPAGWSTGGFNQGGTQTGFVINSTSGVDGSAGLRCNLFTSRREIYVTTPYIEMGSNPQLSFAYRVTDWMFNGVGAPTATENISMKVRITKDNGETWDDDIYTMDYGQHVPSQEYAIKNIDVSEYANELCVVEIWFYWAAGDFNVDVDNITVGTPPVNELAAVAISGNTFPTAGSADTCRVTVRNGGTAEQTDATYTVRLIRESDTEEIASLPGVTIARGETRTFEFLWTPDTEGHIDLRGEVVMANDEMPANNVTALLGVEVQAEGVQSIAIGDGTTGMLSPVDFSSKQSAVQTLYLPEEIGTNGGQLNGIVYRTKLAGARTGKAIKVWVGETDSINLINGWIQPSTLTQVFDGTVDFPAADGASVVIPFSTPYTYKGGSLVVYVFKDDTETHGYSDHFYGRNIINSNRTATHGFTMNNIDPMNPGNAIVTGEIPNITLLMNLTETGALHGTVKDGENNAVEGASVQLAGEKLAMTTGADGKYAFDYLMAGNYTVEASKHGYLATTASVTVAAGDTIEEDILLTAATGYPVSGKVTAPNAPDGITGVTVVLKGYQNYTATTDDGGNYLFTDVYDGYSYEMIAVAGGYSTYIDTVEVAGESVVHNIVLSEIPFPVLNAVAEIENDNAVITWDTPEAITIFGYDSGSADSQFGSASATRNSVFGSAHRVNATLNKMQWYLTDAGGPQTEVNLFVFALDSEGAPTSTVLYSAFDVPAGVNQWSSHEFPNPVEAPSGFLIAISRNTGFLSLGTSNPTIEHPFMEQTQFYSRDYSSTAFIPVETDGNAFNFMIRAEGESFGEIIQLDSKSSNTAAKAPTPVQYLVYRLEEGAAEAQWTPLAGTFTETSCTDTDWATLPGSKVYQYAIRAEYTGGNLSQAVLTNTLPKDMTAQYTVNIATNSGDAATGATVTLTNSNGNLAHVYTGTATDDETVVFPSVWKGVYTITVSKEGFNPYQASSVTIDGSDPNSEHSATLIETINTPFGLEVDVNGATALFTWNSAPYSFTDDMESHADFAISNIGSYVMHDGDGQPAFFFTDINHANAGYTGSYIVMNPSQTVPASNTVAFQPHSGNKYLACFATQTPEANNDWLILPKVKVADGTQLKFYAQNFTLDYDVARFRVAVSVSGTAPADFTVISGSNDVEAPYSGAGISKSWEELSYSLSSYAGQEVYVAIVCVSSDNTSILMLDDISITAPDSKGTKSLTGYNVYLNDEKIASGLTTEEYLFIGLANGDYTAGVETVYTSGTSARQSIPFTITDGAGITTGTLSGIEVYGSGNTVYIVNRNSIILKSVVIADLWGRVVYSGNASTSVTIPVNGPSGVYVVKLVSDDGKTSTKVHLNN